MASTTNLGRALDLLSALGGEEAMQRGGLGVVRMAEIVGRDKSQVSRSLRALADAGFVDRDPDTLDYRLGWLLFTLAARAGHRRLLSLAPPLLRGLVASQGETAHLSVLDGGEVLTVLSERSPSVLRADDWVGRRAPATSTSSGRALLLDHDHRALETLFSPAEFERLGPSAPADVVELHRRILVARSTGYALADGEFEPGLVGVAAPVRDFRGRIVAALNVSAPKFRFFERLEAAGRETRRTAEELSSRMGWVPEAREHGARAV